MSALTSDRMALSFTIKDASLVLAASVKATKGGVACVDTSANAIKPMASGNANLVPVGMFLEDNDNSASGSTSRVLVSLNSEVQGQWLDNATGGAAVTASQLYDNCYGLDDHTVTSTSGSNSVAGIVWDTDVLKGVAVQFPFR
jgi:hypothetical protein